VAITPEAKRQLIGKAIEVREKAYAPYSRYPVGAALLGASGSVHTGVNVENAAYPTGMCAERTAVFAAVAQGERQFEAIAVVTRDGGTPCGACRQVLSEFGLDILVVVANAEGAVTLETTLRGLLPEAFGPENLGE
jgi:cytidine deaminase